MGIFMRCTEPTHGRGRGHRRFGACSRCFLISLTTLPHFPLAPQSGLAFFAAFSKSSFGLRRILLLFSIVIIVERNSPGSIIPVEFAVPRIPSKRCFTPLICLYN